MFTEANRASNILFNFLKSNSFEKKFLLPDNVCEVVPLTFYLAGINFDFVDIDAHTLCMDEDFVLRHATQYSGALFVHTYGVESDFSPFYRQIKHNNPDFTVIDDACLCAPQITYLLPNTIDLKLFSLGHCKQVDIGGAFGFVNPLYHYENHQAKAFDNDLLKDLALDYPKVASLVRERNLLTFLQGEPCSSLDRQLIEEAYTIATEHRMVLNTIYQNDLPRHIQLPIDYQNWRFNIVVDEAVKKNILDRLFANGLFASSHYASQSELWDMPICAHSQALSCKVMNLFNDHHYTTQQAIKTCEIINAML